MNVRPEDSDFVLWTLLLALLALCIVETRKNILYIDGKKGHDRFLRVRGFMATFKGVMLADLRLHMHTAFFKCFEADLPLLKTPGRTVGQCRTVCHLQGSIKLWQALGISAGNKWFVSPIFSGSGFLSNQFTLDENVEIWVPAGGEWEGCISCLPGMAVVHAGVGRVWPGFCTVGSWWSRSILWRGLHRSLL